MGVVTHPDECCIQAVQQAEGRAAQGPGIQAIRQRPAADRLLAGPRQHEAADAVRPASDEFHRHVAAEGVADDEGFAAAGRVDRIDDRGGSPVEAEGFR